jgi:hypothetical protein
MHRPWWIRSPLGITARGVCWGEDCYASSLVDTESAGDNSAGSVLG